jgi:caffeoyl-CoA O-methyltransferase
MKSPHMQVGRVEGALLRMLCAVSGARRVLEVGTFTGYSALAVARGLGEGGYLLCCDVSEEWTAIAREAWEEAGVADRIDLRIAPGADTLRSLPKGESFDFAFIDADKTGYPDYLEEVLPRMRPGGIIAADNVLHMSSWEKPIFDRTADQPALLAIRKFNERLATDARLRSVIVPMRDGVAIALVAR